MPVRNPQLRPDSYYAASITRPFSADQAEGDMQADVCVIGGGYTGASAALHLARQGISVILLEAQTMGWVRQAAMAGRCAPASARNSRNWSRCWVSSMHEPYGISAKRPSRPSAR